MSGSAKRVFISYARSTSRQHALALQRALGAERCFLDVEDIAPDSEFPKRLADALLGAHVVVVLASGVYFQRWYCLREWLLARAAWDARSENEEAAGGEDRLDHLIVAVDQLGPDDLYLLPQPIQRRNLVPATALETLTHLIIQRLERATLTLADRLDRCGVPRQAIDLLIGTQTLPVPPQALAGIPMWPPTQRPSLGERFVGRSDEFWRLHDALWGSRVGGAAATGRTCLVHGGGGFGKTQLALEYVHRMGPRLYRGGLMWVDASGSAPLQDQFRGILKAFPQVLKELGVTAQELDQLAEAPLRQHLARVLHEIDKPVLFVVDNVPEPTKAQPMRELTEYCPAVGQVTCVVTSRMRLPHLARVSVDVVSTDAAVALLQNNVAQDLLSPNEWRELTEWVGRWPLGLDHLNAFMQLDAQSAPRMLQRSRTREISGEISRIAAILSGDMPQTAVRGVTELFKTSLKSLSASARELLFRCSWLAPSPIPRAFVEAMCENADASAAPILALVSRSWLKPAGSDGLLLHRVLAGYLREVQPSAARRTERVLGTMQMAWSASNMVTAGNPSALAPHAGAVIASAVRFGNRLTSIGHLLRSMRDLGAHIADSAPLVFAVSAVTHVLEIAGTDTNNADVARLQIIRGEILGALGYRERAPKFFEEAIAMFSRVLPVLADRFPSDWAWAQNSLGATLLNLGDREQDAKRLQEAIVAFRAALTIQTKDHLPLEWAKAQNNLGIALRILGDLWRDTHTLTQAVDAFRAVLQVRTRDRNPLDWAETQMSLGNALQSLAERTKDTQLMEQAVAAFRSALTVRTRERLPVNWARTLNNLGIALTTLGELRDNAQPLEEAVTTYRAALEVNTKQELPLEWAMTQNNLGAALRSLGDLEKNAERLEEAVAAYRAALEVRTKESLPVDWAATQNNLAVVLTRIGKLQDDSQRMEEGVIAFRAALQVRTKERLPLDWAVTQHNLGLALWSLGCLEQSLARLEEAVLAFRAALDAYSKDATPLQWATAQSNVGLVLLEIGFREKNRGRTEEAVASFRAALEVYTPDRFPVETEDTQRFMDVAAKLIDFLEFSG